MKLDLNLRDGGLLIKTRVLGKAALWPVAVGNSSWLLEIGYV